MLYLILICLFLSFSCDSNSTSPQCDGIVDCLGICNGLAALDECGICNGTGLIEGTCDCDGNILDECEVCNGPGLDCNGQCEGSIIDCTGVCGGDSVLDCEGMCNGDAVMDECGVCNGQGIDCNGLCNTSGCVNMVEIEASSDTSLEILYNVDFNITGFQFEILNIDNITNISSTNPNLAPFLLNVSELHTSEGYIVVGANIVGSSIPAGCGLLINLTHEEDQNNANAEIINIIFTEDINGSPNSPEVCPN